MLKEDKKNIMGELDRSLKQKNLMGKNKSVRIDLCLQERGMKITKNTWNKYFCCFLQRTQVSNIFGLVMLAKIV